MNGTPLSSLPISEFNNSIDLVPVVRSLGQNHYTNLLVTARTLQPYTASYALVAGLTELSNRSLTASYLSGSSILTSSHSILSDRSFLSDTASFSVNSSASYASVVSVTSFNSSQSINSENSISSSYASSSLSASYSITASYSLHSMTASYVSVGSFGSDTIVSKSMESALATSSLVSTIASSSLTASYITSSFISSSMSSLFGSIGPVFITSSLLWTKTNSPVSSWETVDVSSYIPSNTKTVILESYMKQSGPTGGSDTIIQTRPTASSNIVLTMGRNMGSAALSEICFSQVMAPVSNNRTIDFQLTNQGITGTATISLVGYWKQFS